jgi:hypothetical protein
MKTDGEANFNGKKYHSGTTFMVKAFTQNDGNYWVNYELPPIAGKVLFHFLIQDHDQNSILW